MLREIIIEKHGSGNAVVIRHDGKLVDYFLDPPNRKPFFYPPNTYMCAVVQRRIPRNGGYFIKLPSGDEGFLNSKNSYKEGCAVKVVSKVFYEKGKPQNFSDKLKMVFEFFIITPGGGDIFFSKNLTREFNLKELKKIAQNKKITVIFRSSTSKLDPKELSIKFWEAVENFEVMMLALEEKQIFYGGLAKNTVFSQFNANEYTIVEEEGIFETLDIWCQLYKELEPKVNFGNGSYLFVESTKSMSAIDVNSGSDFNSSKEQINLVACEKIFALIKQRGLGGKIIIDFLPSSKHVRFKVIKKMEILFSTDFQKNRLWGWTKSGNFEIERERAKTPLNFLLDE